MARIRSIKPELWTSEQVADCSPLARLLFIGLWSFSDDAGRHPASPRRLKMEVLPADDITAEDVAGFVGEMIAAGLVLEYTVKGKTFWQVTGWNKHQRIDKPTIRYPSPPADKFDDSSTSTPRGLDEYSARPRQPFDEHSTRPRQGSGVEWSGEEKNTHTQPTAVLLTAPPDPAAAARDGLPPIRSRPVAKTDADLRPLFEAACQGMGQQLAWGAKYVLPTEKLFSYGKSPDRIRQVAQFYRDKLSGEAVPSYARFSEQFDRWDSECANAAKPKRKKPDDPRYGAPSGATARGWCQRHPSVGLDQAGCSRCRMEAVTAMSAGGAA